MDPFDMPLNLDNLRRSMASVMQNHEMVWSYDEKFHCEDWECDWTNNDPDLTAEQLEDLFYEHRAEKLIQFLAEMGGL